MTVFICIPWFHPAYKAGGPLQSIANLVNNYQPENLQFKIFCSAYDLDGSANRGVKTEEWVKYNNNTDVWYASYNKQPGTSLKKLLKQTQPAIIFIIGMYEWYYNLLPLLIGSKSHRIVSVRGMLHPGALSQKWFKKKIYLACWKLFRLHHRCSFHISDEQEMKFVQKIFGSSIKCSIAGNYPNMLQISPNSIKIKGSLKMVSIALISPMKNIALVLSALQHCRGTVYYDLYGPIKDVIYWQHCQSLIGTLQSNIQVNYKGDIPPAAVATTLAKYDVFILPSKSENFGHAIYEALSAGRPVITSHNTPFNNLQSLKAGYNVAIKNSDDLAKAINFFTAMDQQEISKWQLAANQYATKAVDMEVLKLQYDNMFGKSIGYG